MASRVSCTPLNKILLSAALTLIGLLALTPPASAEPYRVPDGGTAQTDGRVSAILAVGDTVYLGGDFTQINGTTRNRLAAVDASTGALKDWNPNANGSVRALAASPDGTTIYAGGSFTSVGGTSRGRLAGIDATTGALTSWNPATANSTVRAIAVSGGRVYVGGDFTTLSGKSRNRLGRLDATTGALDPSWNPTTNNIVRALAFSADGSRLYSGGDFTTISGKSMPYLARLDTASGAPDAAWKPPTPNGRVFSLAVSGERVYAGEGGSGGALGAYDASTSARTWSVVADGDVQGIGVLDGKLYVGGHFTVFAGQSRSFFAAVDASTGALDPQWNPNGGPSSLGVWALSADTSRKRIYAGGDFTSVSGQTAQHFAQFSDCTITGTPGDDVLEGTAGKDVICGLGGNDTLKGGDGADTLKGSDGADTLYGGAGNDTLKGEGNSDSLYGEAGDDTFDGGPGSGDTAYYSNSPAGVNASLTTNTATGGEGYDTFVAITNLVGSSYNDTLIGDSVSNRLTGLSGNDAISGGDGADTIFGAGGDDNIYGGLGNDKLDAGAGADTLNGEDGDDTLNSKDGTSGNDTLDGGTGTNTCTTDTTEKSIVNC